MGHLRLTTHGLTILNLPLTIFPITCPSRDPAKKVPRRPHNRCINHQCGNDATHPAAHRWAKPRRGPHGH